MIISLKNTKSTTGASKYKKFVVSFELIFAKKVYNFFVVIFIKTSRDKSLYLLLITSIGKVIIFYVICLVRIPKFNKFIDTFICILDELLNISFTSFEKELRISSNSISSRQRTTSSSSLLLLSTTALTITKLQCNVYIKLELATKKKTKGIWRNANLYFAKFVFVK